MIMGSIIDGVTGRPAQGIRLRSLVEKLKTAEPDRELDTLIWLSAVPGTTRKIGGYTHIASNKWCELDETRDATRRLINVPAYSTSVDAAASLVPLNYVWGCGFSRFVPHQAWVSSSVNAKGEFIGECDTTHALALCIAAVKAIAGSQGDIIP